MDGKKVKHVSWDKGEYVFLNNKTLKRENDDDALSTFSVPTNWAIYEEPKKTKKFYQMMVRHSKRGSWYIVTYLVDENFKTSTGEEYCPNYERKLLTDRVFEIEVDNG